MVIDPPQDFLFPVTPVYYDPVHAKGLNNLAYRRYLVELYADQSNNLLVCNARLDAVEQYVEQQKKVYSNEDMK